ncbi:MAG TPA: hypothetical protein VLF71_04040 [Candidatus Saccharimonadales bacterium]|nr:hypothetical protein [Candidatus Saccharimonadales bacterium]
MPLPETQPAPPEQAAAFAKSLARSESSHLTLVADMAGTLLVERLYPGRMQGWEPFATPEEALGLVDISNRHRALLGEPPPEGGEALTMLPTEWGVVEASGGQGYQLRGLAPYVTGKRVSSHELWSGQSKAAPEDGDLPAIFTFARAHLRYIERVMKDELRECLGGILPRQLLLTPNGPVYVDGDPHIEPTIFGGGPARYLSAGTGWITHGNLKRHKDGLVLKERARELERQWSERGRKLGSIPDYTKDEQGESNTPRYYNIGEWLNR